MFPTVKWLFFDVGSTWWTRQLLYALRLQRIASLANLPYELIWGPPCSFTGKIKGRRAGHRAIRHDKMPAWHEVDGCTLTPDR